MSCVYKNRCSAWISGSVAGAVPAVVQFTLPTCWPSFVSMSYRFHW